MTESPKPHIARLVREVRTQAFEATSQAKRPYTINRGLDAYRTYLPKWQNKTAVQLLEEFLRDNRGRRARIADLGCGIGNYLLGMKIKFGSRIEAIGVTAREYHRRSLWRRVLYKALNIKIIKGDVHRVDKLITPDSCQLVTAYQLFNHLVDPFKALKSAYSILEPNGVGLFYPNFVGDKLGSYLEREYGAQYYGFRGLAIAKNKQKLWLPVSYTGQASSHNHVLVPVRELEYNIDPNRQPPLD